MPTTTVNGPELLWRASDGTHGPTGRYAFVRIRSSTSVYRKRPLDIISNPTPLTVSESFQINGMVRVQNVNPPGTYTENANQSAAGPVAFDPSKTNEEARIRLMEKIKGEDWNLSTFLGELPETIQYFRKTINSAVEGYRAVKRGNLAGVKRAARRAIRRVGKDPRRELHRQGGKAADKWLEWRYAISPLVHDLDDMLKVLYSKRNTIITRRSAGGASGTSREVVRESERLVSRETKWQSRCVAYYRVNPNAEAFKKLGLINLAATLWELTPLSFVVDWLIPIGRYVGTLDAMMGVSVLSSTRSVSSFEKDERVQWSNLGNMSYTPYSYTRKMYSRAVGVDFGFALPTPSLSLNSSRFLDSLALSRKIMLR